MQKLLITFKIYFGILLFALCCVLSWSRTGIITWYYLNLRKSVLHSCFCSKVGLFYFCVSSSEELAVEYLAPELFIVYRQHYYRSSDYLPSKASVLTFLLLFLVDGSVDNVGD